MRPEKFRYEMNKAFERWFQAGTTEQFGPLLREMNRVWRKWSVEEDDYRTGKETYCYSDRETIENNMVYISDRWRCASRLKWLIDGIKENKI